jgi:hypothetical protein
MQNEGLKLMVIDSIDQQIKFRFISNWFKIDSYVSNKKMLLSSIEMIDPDVVVMDLGVYEKMDGIAIMVKTQLKCDLLQLILHQ